jgi:hypothetical protein
MSELPRQELAEQRTKRRAHEDAEHVMDIMLNRLEFSGERAGQVGMAEVVASAARLEIRIRIAARADDS